MYGTLKQLKQLLYSNTKRPIHNSYDNLNFFLGFIIVKETMMSNTVLIRHMVFTLLLDYCLSFSGVVIILSQYINYQVGRNYTSSYDGFVWLKKTPANSNMTVLVYLCRPCHKLGGQVEGV